MRMTKKNIDESIDFETLRGITAASTYVCKHFQTQLCSQNHTKVKEIDDHVLLP